MERSRSPGLHAGIPPPGFLQGLKGMIATHESEWSWVNGHW
ncbi:hypothetical protein MHB50_19705 [Siminovitchia sp. FSL H7-0308]|uniref:Uncharacterized protein n=1 Tax=Siminovitchia thermophila TaxID=1245522 RepID=A0ABS2RAQ5_9BACI|nr:hypothetical protein [Siminovitchia thermophila]MBM7716684.1 hypothetical protein [Siminovitchia thermophila]